MLDNSHIFGLHNRDVRELQTFLAKYGYYKEFVDVTITSPPYYDVKSYGYRNQIGYGQKYLDYLNDVEEVFRNIFHITRDTGSLWLIVDTYTREGRLVNLPFEISKRLENCDWNLVDIIVWKKNKSLPWSKKGRLRDIFEYILFFTKNPQSYKFFADKIRVADLPELKEWWVTFPERYNPKGRLPTNLWEFPIPTQGSWSNKHLKHSNPLPPKLVKRILLLSTDENDVVLDPFAGSGIVLAVADFLNRNWLGFEMNENYCESFQKDVLNEIEEELHAEEKRRKELEPLREQYEETIKNLRLVKFPKSLIRECNRRKILETEMDSLNSIFAISRDPTNKELSEMPENKFMVEDLFLIFQGNIKVQAITDAIKKLTSRPPLSKFGIEPRIFVSKKDEFVLNNKNTFIGNSFWLYAYGVTYRFERQIAFSEWLSENATLEWKDYSKNCIPPIISNIRVNQTIDRTWKSKEEKFNILKRKYNKLIYPKIQHWGL